MEVSLIQLLNADTPISIILFGIITDVRPVEANAPVPIEVTLFGIVTEVRLAQSPNAPFLIVVTLFGIVYTLFCLPTGYRIKVSCALLNNTPSIELYERLSLSTFMDVMELELQRVEKAPFPMNVTLLGIVMDIRLTQL
jgi:hypothetical protein